MSGTSVSRAALLATLALAGCGSPTTPARSGAAPTSGAQGGASPLVASSSGPDATSPCPGLFCDDFEDDAVGDPPSLPWSTEPEGAVVAVSDARAFSGWRSVVVRAGTARYEQGYISLRGAPLFPQLRHEHFGRVRLWLDSTPEGSVHFTFIQAEGPSLDGSHRVLDRFGGQHQGRLMANYETLGVSTDCWDHSQTVMPTRTWVCLEWHFSVEGNEMELWLDGRALEDVHTRGQGEGCVGDALAGQWLPPREFDALRIGYEHYQASNARDVYVDDVAVGSSRVGCDR